MMVAIVSVSFASCSSDDENGGNKDTDALSIVGTWVQFSEKEIKWGLVNGDWVFVYERDENKEVSHKALYFGADGTYYKMYRDSEGFWLKGPSVSSYYIQGNNLILGKDTYKFSISGNILEITDTEIEGDEREDEVKRYRKM